MISDCLHRLDALCIQMYPRCMVEVFLACRGLIGWTRWDRIGNPVVLVDRICGLIDTWAAWGCHWVLQEVWNLVTWTVSVGTLVVPVEACSIPVGTCRPALVKGVELWDSLTGQCRPYLRLDRYWPVRVTEFFLGAWSFCLGSLVGHCRLFIFGLIDTCPCVSVRSWGWRETSAVQQPHQSS